MVTLDDTNMMLLYKSNPATYEINTASFKVNEHTKQKQGFIEFLPLYELNKNLNTESTTFTDGWTFDK